MKLFKKISVALCGVLFTLALSIGIAACDNSGTGGGGTGSQKTTYLVTLTYDEAQGRVALSPVRDGNRYEEGENVTVTLEPKPGRTISSFKVNGTEKALDENNSYTFSVTGDTTVEAVIEAVAMDEQTFSSLVGDVNFDGFSNQMRVYDGFPDNLTEFDFAYTICFDGSLVSRFKLDDDMKLVLVNEVYQDEDGKAVKYKRTAQNTVERTETGEDFAGFANPFGTLIQREDIIVTGDGVYSIEDPEKASAAAKALTGETEELDIFSLYAADKTVHTVVISTKTGQRGEGITLNYTYNTDYTFYVSQQPVDLSDRLLPYELQDEHVALEHALQNAAAAESYFYHVVEDGRIEYNIYVTDTAYYSDEGLGFAEAPADGGGTVVKDITLNEAGNAFVFGEPVLIDGEDENGEYLQHRISDIHDILAHFEEVTVALFEPKGEGVFELRPDDRDLAPAMALLFFEGNDSMSMLFANSVQITVKNEMIEKVFIQTSVMGFDTTYEYTYSGWDETSLPYQIAGEQTSDATPTKYYGTFADTDGKYLITISESGMTAVVDGAPVEVTELSYNGGADEFTFKLQGEGYSLTPNSDDDPLTELALWKGYSLTYLYRQT